jgi:GTP-binding protein
MAENGLSFTMIFTKVDKLTIADRAAFLPRYTERMLKQWSAMPPHFVTSAEKGDGRQDVLGFIAQTNPSYRQPPAEEV